MPTFFDPVLLAPAHPAARALPLRIIDKSIIKSKYTGNHSIVSGSSIYATIYACFSMWLAPLLCG